MAIVRSLGVGKGRKSAGELTYRVSRGRTIASQRIVSNGSNTPAQQLRRGIFGNVNKALVLMIAYIDNAFERSRYGSKRNNFVKLNKGIMSNQIAAQQLVDGAITPMMYMRLMLTKRLSNVDGELVKIDPPIVYVSYGSSTGVYISPGDIVGSAELPQSVKDVVAYKSVTFSFPSAIDSKRLSLNFVRIGNSIDVGTGDTMPNYIDYYRIVMSDNSIIDNVMGLPVGFIKSITVSISPDIDTSVDYDQSIIVPVLAIDNKVTSSKVALMSPLPAASDVASDVASDAAVDRKVSSKDKVVNKKEKVVNS